MSNDDLEKLAHGRDYEYRKAIFERLNKQDITLEEIKTALVGKPELGTTGLVKRVEAVEKEQEKNKATANKINGAWILITTLGASFIAAWEAFKK